MKQEWQQKDKKNQKTQKKKELDYDSCDFPIAYSDKRLVEDWFEFNDSHVTPI